MGSKDDVHVEPFIFSIFEGVRLAITEEAFLSEMLIEKESFSSSRILFTKNVYLKG